MSSRHWLAALAALSIIAAACGDPVISSALPSGVPTTSPSTAGAGASVAPRPPACPDQLPSSAAAAPWWEDRVFYEVFVRSFADSDGDGIGDLQGLTSRLDALNDGDPSTTDDLGVTALWLMPVAASPSYHGYDVTDYRTIEPDYGTNDDFKALVAAARERGIEIIVDLVMNHTSSEHPWFEDARTPGSEHDDWYVWADDHPGFGGPGGRPVWHADGDRWYYGYFWEGMPDLDVANTAVTAEMDSIARFWVDEMGVAGFRLDAARHLLEDGSTLENSPATFDWLRGFADRLKQTSPDALVLGEVWDATSMASRYVREGALDLTFDFGLAAQMLQAVRDGEGASLRFVQAEVTAAYPAGGYAAFLSNHDQDRTFDALGQDVAKAKQAATLLLTNPGVPFIYYGEEIGLRGRKPDERIRTPMPWTGEGPGYGFTTGQPWQPFADGVESANVATQASEPDSLLAHYRALIALRSSHPALGPRGSLTAVDSAAKAVYVVLRHDAASGERLLVLTNLSDQPVDGPVLDLQGGPLCGAPSVTVAFGAGEATAPLVNATGGFDDYVPVPRLAPHESVVIDVGP